MACVERGSFGVFKKTPGATTLCQGGGGKFKSGGGVGSLFVKDKRVDHTKSCEIQWIYKKPRNYIVYVWEIAQSMKGYNIFVLENIETVKFCLKKKMLKVI